MLWNVCLLLIIQFKNANMVEQSQLLNEIKKLEASARQYQQEVSPHICPQNTSMCT